MPDAVSLPRMRKTTNAKAREQVSALPVAA
jgi:hypothetical protein